MATNADIAALQAALDAANETISANSAAAAEVAAGLNGAYMLVSAFLVFLMQTGFAMLCAGSVRSKNTMNILLKNVLDACAGAVAFYLFGYAFAYGECGDQAGSRVDFIGCGYFALDGMSGADWVGYLFQWAFAATAATIVSGSVAERTNLIAYFAYAVLLSAFVYPVVVHWIWGGGWLSAFGRNSDPDGTPFAGSGMIDFAGSGVVHLTGGIAGLVGAAIVGPRTGRFDQGRAVPMPGHSATLVVLGTFILWFGWYGFNPGSQLAIADAGSLEVTGRVAVTTTMGAAAGGLGNLFLTYFQTGTWDLMATCNGLLAGLVSVTAGCPVIEPWAALLAGAIGAVIFNYSCKLLEKFQIDDPLAAAPMHGICGIWACLFTGLFAKRGYVCDYLGACSFNVFDITADAFEEPLVACDPASFESAVAGAQACVRNMTEVSADRYGAFYGGNGTLLGVEILGCFAIIVWVGGIMGILFYALKMAGLLRVKPEVELAGLDVSKHGGSAYNNDAAADALKAR